MNRTNTTTLLTAAILSLAACNRAELEGPPSLRLGRDECKECGMLINEDRCSSGMLIDQDGRRAHILFDDLGCMLDMDPKHSDVSAVLETYVHDYNTKVWVRSDSAHFLFANPKALPTPMGSGAVAFMHRVDAEAAQKQHGGEILTYEALRAARKKFMEERYGKRSN